MYVKNWENDRCKVCKNAYQIYTHEWTMESDVRSDGDYMHLYLCIPKVHVYYWQSGWHVIFNCWFALIKYLDYIEWNRIEFNSVHKRNHGVYKWE